MTPPLGLITVAALCPPSWKIRLMDQCFEEIRDEDLLAADLVMISGMHAQRFHARDILLRARALGRRTFVGGPWASTDPEGVLECADHVIVGEADEAFPAIASGTRARATAQRLYRVDDKPDITRAPSRASTCCVSTTTRPCRCSSRAAARSSASSATSSRSTAASPAPRRPSSSSPSSTLCAPRLAQASLHRRRQLHRQSAEGARPLAREIADWQVQHNHPFRSTPKPRSTWPTSPELLNAMVAANFMYVFIGIETPASEALKRIAKFQNLRAATR